MELRSKEQAELWTLSTVQHWVISTLSLCSHSHILKLSHLDSHSRLEDFSGQFNILLNKKVASGIKRGRVNEWLQI